MISSYGLFFREIYLKILLSMLLVVTAMLLLQGALTHLKLRALIAEATSSRHQIAASSIEAAVVKAESLGFAIDQMTGLQDLIDRKQGEDESIAAISVISPIGTPIMISGDVDPEDLKIRNVLRHILGAQDKLTLYDRGEYLFTGRQLFDSSGALMGAIVIIAPTDIYLGEAGASFTGMWKSYSGIFVVTALILVPLILFQFAGVRNIFGALALIGAPDIAKGAAAARTENVSAGVSDLQDLIVAGEERYQEEEVRLQKLVDDDRESREHKESGAEARS